MESWEKEDIVVDHVPDVSEAEAYTIPEEACCSPEFPQGCIFSD